MQIQQAFEEHVFVLLVDFMLSVVLHYMFLYLSIVTLQLIRLKLIDLHMLCLNFILLLAILLLFGPLNKILKFK